MHPDLFIYNPTHLPLCVHDVTLFVYDRVERLCRVEISVRGFNHVGFSFRHYHTCEHVMVQVSSYKHGLRGPATA